MTVYLLHKSNAWNREKSQEPTRAISHSNLYFPYFPGHLADLTCCCRSHCKTAEFNRAVTPVTMQPGLILEQRDESNNRTFAVNGPEAGRGTGLGLPTVYSIVQQHDGFIHATGELGNGAAFEIYLCPESRPTESDLSPESGPDTHRTNSAGTRTVLLVIDDKRIRMSTGRVLKKAGYRVLVAGNGLRVIEFCQEYQEEIDRLLMDVVRPEMIGSSALRTILPINKEIPVIFCTGYNELPNQEDRDLLANCPILKRPSETTSLLHSIRNLLGAQS